MFHTIYSFELAVHRHQSAPLRNERERFLEKLREGGANRHLLQHDATLLLHIVEQLKLQKLRAIDYVEIKRAANKWIRTSSKGKQPAQEGTLFYAFAGLAKRFLKF